MATPAQLAANRANAQRSTGPRSAEGKSVSRFNALKHGADADSPVIPGEDPAEYQELAAEYLHRFQPETPDERYHVQTMIDSTWQKRRLDRLEAECYHILDTENPGMCLAAALLSASPAAKLLARTQRQQAAHQRAWYRAFTELRRQREREEDGDSQWNTEPAPIPEEPECSQVEAISESPERTQSAAPRDAKSWPPVDEKTGKPLFFVG